MANCSSPMHLDEKKKVHEIPETANRFVLNLKHRESFWFSLPDQLGHLNPFSTVYVA